MSPSLLCYRPEARSDGGVANYESWFVFIKLARILSQHFRFYVINVFMRIMLFRELIFEGEKNYILFFKLRTLFSKLTAVF
jgi:hypothetical protein